MNTAIPQPKGLYLLFFTEMWERFGFYTVQTILVLYMSQKLLFSDAKADTLANTFNAMLYLTPVLGGYLADRFLGFQKSIILGGILFTLGYALSAIPEQSWFFLGLSFVVLGNGLFKPNVSSIVGELYEPNDIRRESGFTIFYMGINIGAILPPIFIGYIVQHWGWHYGFIFATLGMCFGIINFYLGRQRLKGKGELPCKIQGTWRPLQFYSYFVLGIVGALFLLSLVFRFPDTTGNIVLIGTGAIILVVLYFLFQEPVMARKRLAAAIILILLSIGFWAIYNQTFSSLMLYADRNMNPELFGIPINAEFTQFFNPFFIIVLSPLLSRLWVGMGEKYNPSIPVKFALGILMIAIGIGFLALGASLPHPNGVMSAWWLVGSYGLQTVGELLLSPVGLAMITMLCPRHLVGMMMGVWFLAQSSSFVFANMLASYSVVPNGASVVQALVIYKHAFYIYALVGAIFALFAFLLVPLLKRIIR